MGRKVRHEGLRLHRTITNAAEARFAAEMDAQGKTWFHQPKSFDLPAPLSSYRPDFYVVEDQAFYEVLGTRQAYSYARTRLEAFAEQYPHLKLITVNAGAWVNGPDAEHPQRVAQPKRADDRPRPYNHLADLDVSLFHPDVVELLDRARERGHRTYLSLALLARVPPHVLYTKLRWFKPDPDLIASLTRALETT